MQKTIFFILLSLFFHCGYSQVFNEIIKATAFDRADADRFGYAVDITENYAIVGAYADDFSELDPNMGSAYIFEKTGPEDWTFVQKISSSDQDDYDRFGWSVAIDGDKAVIGAYAEDHNLENSDLQDGAGSAYIFERNADGLWEEKQKIIASDRSAGDEFGWAVDISGDWIVVGAHFEDHSAIGTDYIYNSGAAYVFNRGGDGTWSETQKIVASDRSADIDFPTGGGPEEVADQFGHAVSIYNNQLIIGAFRHDYDVFGGSPENEAGAAYIFELDGGIWSESTKLQASDRQANDQFGYAVSIYENRAIISAPTEQHNAGGGATLSNAGSVYAFEYNEVSEEWIQTQKIVAFDRSTGDRFGWSVEIYDTTVVVGSPRANIDEMDEIALSDAGAAYTYIFDPSAESWMLLSKLDASDREVDDRLGTSVALHNNNIILGAFQQDYDTDGAAYISDAGAAYIFRRVGCSPTSSSQTFTLCQGQSVTVGPHEYTETGVYTDIILSYAGCDSIVTTDLTILPAPTSAQTVTICHGYSYDIGGSSYTVSGIYEDTLSNAEGCDSIVTTDLTILPENSVNQEVTICWGESYTIGASTYTSPGTYTDIITAHDLCDSVITTHLTVQLPVDVSITQSLNLLTAGAAEAEYQWLKCDPYTVIPGANEQSYWAPEFGQYAVIITEGSCTDTSSCVYVDVLGIEENKPAFFTVYPNPNNGQVKLENLPYQLGTNLNLSLLSINGTLIDTYPVNSAELSLTFENIMPGIYVLKLEHNTMTTYRRIVIQ